MSMAASCAEDTVGRGPVPRHASVFAETVRGLWAADGFRFSGTIAGDRPPRYGTSDVFRLDRTLAGPRATVAAAFFREITLTKNATFAKINSVLNIFGDFSQKNVDKKPKFM